MLVVERPGMEEEGALPELDSWVQALQEPQWTRQRTGLREKILAGSSPTSAAYTCK